MRVVLDTNILVSFAIRPSIEFEKIFDHIAAHGISLISEAMIAELFAVLSRDKFRKYIALKSAIDYVEWYVGISENVEIIDSVVACRHAKDDKFLEVAVNGNADLILSGDDDLLVLNPFRGIRILAPADFIKGIAN